MRVIMIAIVLLSLCCQALAQEASSRPQNAALYIISPHSGEVVNSPVRVRFGLSGMGIAPAGIQLADTGHHHLLVDLEELPDLNQPLPATAQIIHFGKGQTETEVDLPPGRHTLRLMLGDYLHRPHDPPLYSPEVTIEVAAPAGKE
ncbi:MAG: DUF4399 domain-containing protein [Wenzhouxiangellaceae bacterium]